MNLIILIPLQKPFLMKNVLLIVFLIGVCGCKSTASSFYFKALKKPQTFTTSKCISNAQCRIEIIPDATLLVQEDAFNNTYVEIKKGNRLIIKYQLKKNQLPQTADGHYTEILYFEIGHSETDIHLKDKELQQVKMTFGRLCYCKGSSGYFKVDKGTLELIFDKNKMILNTVFTVKNIPQIITQLHEEITF